MGSDLIERLRAGGPGWNCGALCVAAEAADEITVLRERVAALEGALDPFATAADDIDERTRDDSNMWEHPASMNVYASDFRSARALLSNREPQS